MVKLFFDFGAPVMILTKSHLIEAIAEQNGFTSKKILRNKAHLDHRIKESGI